MDHDDRTEILCSFVLQGISESNLLVTDSFHPFPNDALPYRVRCRDTRAQRIRAWPRHNIVVPQAHIAVDIPTLNIRPVVVFKRPYLGNVIACRRCAAKRRKEHSGRDPATFKGICV